jgi:SP family arabinose:H+ symporter-like MFS transporter
MYYAPRIFTAAGLDTTSAIGHSVLIGLVMLFFTCFAMVLADRCGRRPLLLISAVGMTIGLGVLGWIFGEGRTDKAGALVLWILVYVAAFSIGMGPLVWTVIVEIFPNAMRGRAVGLCVLLLWLANFLVSQFFPPLLATFGAHSFWFYGAFGVVSVVLIHFRVHETKGKSLEAITRDEMT